jgi:hypothetical protein
MAGHKPIVVIDGLRFDDFAGFCAEVSAHLGPGHEWHGNLDAFNDILRGGFGTPEGGFIFRWTSSDRSRAVLGRDATITWLQDRIEHCHPQNVSAFRAELDRLKLGEGQTLFDMLVEIIRDHGANGSQRDDGVELELL